MKYHRIHCTQTTEISSRFASEWPDYFAVGLLIPIVELVSVWHSDLSEFRRFTMAAAWSVSRDRLQSVAATSVSACGAALREPDGVASLSSISYTPRAKTAENHLR